jgi:hypothetical protein
VRSTRIAARAAERAGRERATAYRVRERDGHAASREQRAHRHPAQRDAADRDQPEAETPERQTIKRHPTHRDHADRDVAHREDPARDARPTGRFVHAARDVDQRQAENRDLGLVFVAPPKRTGIPAMKIRCAACSPAR